MIRTLFLGIAVAATILFAPVAGNPQDEKKPEKKSEKDDLKERAQKHKKDVVDLRGLEFKNEVTVGVYSKKELFDFLKVEFDRELPKEKALKYQRAYALFGLIPEDMDIYQAYLDLYSSSIAGFYHPKTKELRLIDSDADDAEKKMAKAMGIDMDAITLVHELTHAAQDQNFELSTLPLEDETNDDLVSAIKAVVEGDASVVGYKYGFKAAFERALPLLNGSLKSGEGLPGKAGSLPAYLRLTLTFPYGYGSEFVMKYIKSVKGDFKDVSKLFKDMPLSTEQIMHPEKYCEPDQRDNPILVTLPDLSKILGAGWTESFNNVHGEFVIWILLKELFSEDIRREGFKREILAQAALRKAAAGWGGDRYVILEKTVGEKTQTMYAWYSAWDTEKDAKEFVDAYGLALERKYDLEGTDGVREDKTAFKTSKGHVLVERRTKDVLVLEGAPEALLGNAEAIWKGAKKSEMTQVERLKKFVCEKDGVKEAFGGKCPKCGAALQFKDDDKPKDDKKKKRDYALESER
jgi:hypothetical protein